MFEWEKQVQIIIDEIDKRILDKDDESLSLKALAKLLGYSEFHTTRKFKEVSGLGLKDYMSLRKLAFALKELRDSKKSVLEIALNYGFSSHEAFTRAFKRTYGLTPIDYRKKPRPVVLRTRICAFDRYLLGLDEIGIVKSVEDIKVYFVTIPAHKFLYIKNNNSNGYWDFWEKQKDIPGQDYETICGLLDSIKGKLDDFGGYRADSGSGQIMAYINDTNGRLCDWGFLRSECHGIRLPIDYDYDIPTQMILSTIPEKEYIVFEHGPFDYNQENRTVENKIEKCMASFDFSMTDYVYDTESGRVMYFYHNPEKFWKYIRPIKRITSRSA